MNETKTADLLKQMNMMLAREVQKMQENEPAVNLKWLSFLFKHMPMQFTAILDACFETVLERSLGAMLV